MEQTYYEQTRDAIERIGGCTTSDAQGIIDAWEIRNGGTMMEQMNMDKAEAAGTQPEDLARAILGMPPDRVQLEGNTYTVIDDGERAYLLTPTTVTFNGKPGTPIEEVRALAALTGSKGPNAALRWGREAFTEALRVGQIVAIAN